MAKEELMQFDGLVVEILPDARYRVQLDQGHEIVAYTAGKMKKNRIKMLAGDRVTVEMSPYDLEKGRLVFRHKDERSSGTASAGSRRRPVPPPLSGRPTVGGSARQVPPISCSRPPRCSGRGTRSRAAGRRAMSRPR